MDEWSSHTDTKKIKLWRVESLGWTGYAGSARVRRNFVNNGPGYLRIDLRADIGTFASNDAKRAQKFLFGFGLQQVSLGASTKGTAHQLCRFVQGEQNDFYLRLQLVNGPRGFNSVQLRHGNIHNDDIGIEIARHANGGDAIFRFAHKFPFRRSVQDGLNATANKSVI